MGEIFLELRVFCKIFRHFTRRKAEDGEGKRRGVQRSVHSRNAELLLLLWFACNSHVLMLPKPGKPNYDEMKLFRPISLNSFLLKGLERLVVWELEDTALRRTPFHPAQNAFRKGQSCDIALSEVVDKVESGIMRDQYALGVFLDIQGAFDNVSWTKVIQLMHARGFPGRLTQWYAHFLQNRIITYSNEKGVTHSRGLTKGTRQGRVLSPVC